MTLWIWYYVLESIEQRKLQSTQESAKKIIIWKKKCKHDVCKLPFLPFRFQKRCVPYIGIFQEKLCSNWHHNTGSLSESVREINLKIGFLPALFVLVHILYCSMYCLVSRYAVFVVPPYLLWCITHSKVPHFHAI